MKKFIKILTRILGIILAIITLLLAGLTIYDTNRCHQIGSRIDQIKINDTRDKVIRILGQPISSWNIGEHKFSIFGNARHENSGMVYGKMMDWKNPFSSEFPFIFPFELRLFNSTTDGDIVIHLNEKGVVLDIEKH